MIFNLLAVMGHIIFGKPERILSPGLQLCQLVPADLQQLFYVLLLRVVYFLFSHSHVLLSRFPAYFDL